MSFHENLSTGVAPRPIRRKQLILLRKHQQTPLPDDTLIGIIHTERIRFLRMLKLRLMTLNLGGGIKSFSGPEDSADKTEASLELIHKLNPDLLAVQEVAQYVNADGILHSMVARLASSVPFAHSFYGETLSTKHNMQLKQKAMIQAIFNDWWDWSKGNAFFSRLPFSQLSDSNRPGEPRNLPIFQPHRYEGTRDTDPRFVILTRLMVPPYPFVLNLHLTTLVGERGTNVQPKIVEKAQQIRAEQIQRILDLLEAHVLRPGLPLILLGDFNALQDEHALKKLLFKEHGFVRLIPDPDLATHPTAGAVDHICFFPASRLLNYHAFVVDSELSHRVSDHLPVVADLSIE